MVAISKKIFLLTILSLIILLLVYAGFIKSRSVLIKAERPLVVRWEGLYHDKNFRDVGESINSCLKQKVMKTGVIFRSNGWFSGWDCEKVGNPDSIISLNYDPKKNKQSFCWSEDNDEAVIGVVPDFNTKLNDLEFMYTWEDEKSKNAACSAIKSVMNSVLNNKKTLIHCDAGRDRTGWMAALLSMIVFEDYVQINANTFDAIECDYRKTASLAEKKYGRMSSFFNKISENSSVSNFLKKQCGIEENITHDVAYRLTNEEKLAKITR